ncbi:hypothetical protein Athai_34500 [Actinocatenispora thailandica]|uniref:HRDC domain-containing protein n=1 Tax=Actinocatenispora thailandica TaxID=227318 RepID=A0A7R7HX93_9ACTN|nr:hypothetical protein Athai_34500 [Actinocatenispora thailandica]
MLPDAAIVAAAQADPGDERELTAVPGFAGRGARRLGGTWLEALLQAKALSAAELPAVSVPPDGPPPTHRWAERDPAAAARLVRARAAVGAIAADHTVPPENLLTPDTLRRLAWSPPQPVDQASVRVFLAEHGARSWQIGLTLDALTGALTDE